MALKFNIESISNGNMIFESNVTIKEKKYVILYGTYREGFYICIPNRNIGFSAAEPNNIISNAKKLEKFGLDPEIAWELSKAISSICEQIS